MTAGEHQAETVVFHFAIKPWQIGVARIGGPLNRRDNFRLLIAESLFSPNQVQGQILRRLRQPRRWVFGDSIVRPGLQGPDQRLLDHILGQLQTIYPKNTCQYRNQLAGFMTEEMFRQSGNLPWGYGWLFSSFGLFHLTI